MHPEAWSYLEDALTPYERAGMVPRVVEFGSRDVNGSARTLLPSAADFYLGIDIADGPGVDLVLDAADWHSSRIYDIAVCTEVFEHTARWPEICARAQQALLDGGMFVVTAASDPRGPHSAVDGFGLRDGEYYGNVDPSLLHSVLRAVGFDLVHVTVHERGDVYAKAIR